MFNEWFLVWHLKLTNLALAFRPPISRARRVALDQLDGAAALEVMVFDRDGRLIGHAAGW